MGSAFVETWTIGVLVVVTMVQITASETQNNTSTANEILRKLLINYDKTIPPWVPAGKPIEVKVGMFWVNLQIDELHETATVIMYFRQTWKDERLQFENKSVRLSVYEWERIWLPDTFIRGQTKPASVDHRLLRVNASGTVFYVQRMYITVPLIVHHRSYPRTRAQIPILIESFSHTMDQFYLTAMDNPMELDADIHRGPYYVYEHVIFDCSQNYTSGVYTCLEFKLQLSRELGSFILNIGLPITLVFALSWLSLWLSPTSTGNIVSRILIGLVTILLSFFIGHWNRSSGVLSSVSLVTAGDIFTVGSLMIVVASFIESLTVIQLTSYKATGDTDLNKSSAVDKLRKVDYLTMILIPVAFVVVIITAACV